MEGQREYIWGAGLDQLVAQGLSCPAALYKIKDGTVDWQAPTGRGHILVHMAQGLTLTSER